MDAQKIAEQVKQVIMSDLFNDINNNQCVIDLFLNDSDRFNEIHEKINKVSQLFLERAKAELQNEQSRGNILFFRKYAYEKILNDYLEKIYHVDFLEMNMFPSDEREKELEQQRLERKKIDEQRKKEEIILKNIGNLHWEKVVRVDSVIYKSVDSRNYSIELHVINSRKKKETYTDYKLFYNKKLLRYAEFNGNNLLRIIESTKPKKQPAENTSVIIKPENLKSSIKQKEESSLGKNENNKSNTAHEFFVQISNKYKLKSRKVQSIAVSLQNSCKYRNKNKWCAINNRKCSIIYVDCIHYNTFISNIKKESRKKPESRDEKIRNNLDVLSKQIYIGHFQKIGQDYSIETDSVKEITLKIQNKCSYCKNGSCLRTLQNCEPYYKKCIFYDEFKRKLISRSIEENRRKQTMRSAPNSSKCLEQKTNQTSNSSKKISEKSQLIEIGIKDFVVRSNVFKCMHSKHKIDNIDAMINVINNNDIKQLVRISAGYCSQCNVYFIMDSTYQNLKNKGIILCRISDEKTYMKSGCINGMKLAKESILMQYGYNVSQTKGLTHTKRQKILAIIIDNKIMSKSEIISYLDFFINQRSGMSNMGIAISKWEADREFIENYRSGEYTKFGVNAIYRR